jgi:hypothetical protein
MGVWRVEAQINARTSTHRSLRGAAVEHQLALHFSRLQPLKRLGCLLQREDVRDGDGHRKFLLS